MPIVESSTDAVAPHLCLMWNRYLQPTSLAEALQALAEYRDSARVINGGTDLIIEIERKLRAPSVVVDISRIPGLDAIRVE
ncbi:MAG: FAD binding domain-containing protein, partial [Chloroflexi bacterium]|nr:FAD binding domain-containing protein [Chloroflexota bacterium]